MSLFKRILRTDDPNKLSEELTAKVSGATLRRSRNPDDPPDTWVIEGTQDQRHKINAIVFKHNKEG